MSNKETDDYALAGSPVRLSGTAQSVHALLLHRFDQRQFIDGKPNKGYRKSYPSMTEIQTWCTGVSRQSVSRAIEELIAKGLIIRVEIGRPGQRANYVPIYVLGLVGDYVNNALHKSKNYKKVAVSDKPDSALCKQSLPNVSRIVDTISSTSNESNNRNKDRFSDFLHLLPNHLQGLKQGSNLNTCLDVLATKCVPLSVTARHLSEHNYNGATNPLAVAVKRLQSFSESAQSTGVQALPQWCGECDETMRTLAYRYDIPGGDGATTNSCKTCSKFAQSTQVF